MHGHTDLIQNVVRIIEPNGIRLSSFLLFSFRWAIYMAPKQTLVMPQPSDAIIKLPSREREALSK